MEDFAHSKLIEKQGATDERTDQRCSMGVSFEAQPLGNQLEMVHLGLALAKLKNAAHLILTAPLGNSRPEVAGFLVGWGVKVKGVQKLTIAVLLISCFRKALG